MQRMSCPICLEDFGNGKKRKQTYTLPCGHKFHTECIVHAFRMSSSKCPVCRDDVARSTPKDDDDELSHETIRGLLMEDDNHPISVHPRTIMVMALCMSGMCYAANRCAIADTIRICMFGALFTTMFLIDDDVYRVLPYGMHIEFQIL